MAPRLVYIAGVLRGSRIMKRHSLVILSAAIGALATLAPPAAAGPECDRAMRELDLAQQALSKAVRQADSSAAAYSACMEKGTACATQKAAYGAAAAAKGKALAAFKAASSKRQTACQ
jgi:hypothetical protein